MVTLEAELGKLIGELHTRMAVLKERSQRLDGALAAHADLSSRLSLALRESRATAASRADRDRSPPRYAGGRGPVCG